MWDFSNATDDEVEQLRRRYEPLAESVRRLVDATLRTEVGDDVVASVKTAVDAATDRLRERQLDGTPGISVMPNGAVAWGNVAIGPRNAFAPPMVVTYDNPSKAHIDLDLGAAYEGPPGHLHGGYCALILDHLFGEVASFGSPDTAAATVGLSVTYRRPTPLGPLHAEAEVRTTEGRKIHVTGSLADVDGTTVTAEGVFIAL